MEDPKTSKTLSLQIPTKNLKCRACSRKVVDPIQCPGCQANYHINCTETRITLIEGIGYAKCCGPDPSRNLSPTASTASDQCDETLFPSSGVNTIEVLSAQMANMSSRLLSGQNRVEAVVSQLQKEMVKVGKKFQKLDDNVSSIQQEIVSLSDRVEDMEYKITETETTVANLNISRDSILGECEDRYRRRNFFIIFGLSEQIDNSGSFNLD